MRQQFLKAVWEDFIGRDEASFAELFNIYASTEEYGVWRNLPETIVFNIKDRHQAARAVSIFGFEAVAKAAADDWIIYAVRGEDGKWQFSSKAPSETVEEHLEFIILDFISRPREYPEWVCDVMALHFSMLLNGAYDNNK